LYRWRVWFIHGNRQP